MESFFHLTVFTSCLMCVLHSCVLISGSVICEKGCISDFATKFLLSKAFCSVQVSQFECNPCSKRSPCLS